MERDDETLTARDLVRIFFRAQDAATGRWRTVDAASASDAEFDAWVRSRLTVLVADDGLWSPRQRAEVCTYLRRHHGLVLMSWEGYAALVGARSGQKARD